MNGNHHHEAVLSQNIPRKKPTVAAIAEQAGVSRSTVSHVLNQKEPFFSRFTLETRRRVISAAQSLGYPVNESLLALGNEERQPGSRSSGRAPRIADVAQRAGVSKTTASYILSNNYPYAAQFTVETRERVLRAAEELNYSANVLATGLRRPGSGLIGVHIGGASYRDETFQVYLNPRSFDLIRGINEVALNEDLLPIVRLTPNTGDRYDTRLVKRLRRAGVSGLLLHAPSGELVRSLVNARGVPSPFVILLGGEYADLTSNWVDLDNQLAGGQAASLLVDLGARAPIVLAEHSIAPLTQLQRVHGARQAFSDRGVSLSDERILMRPRPTTPEEHAECEHELRTLMAQIGCDAVLALTGGFGVIAQRCLASAHSDSRPRLLVGFDLSGSHLNHAIRTFSVEVNWGEAGRLGAHKLVTMMANNINTTEPLLLPPVFIEQQS